MIFVGSDPASITNTGGSPVTYFGDVTVNKENSQLNVDIAGVTRTGGLNQANTFFTPTNDWLTLQNGSFRYLRNDDLYITTTDQFNIPSSSSLYIDATGGDILISNANSNNNDVYLDGNLTIVDGNVSIGTTSNNNQDIEYSGGGGFRN